MRVASAYELPFEDGFFDTAHGHNIVHHLDPSPFGAELARVLKPGGIVAFDNALWHDRVADPAQRDAETVAIRELGKTVRDHDRLLPLLLPVGDGLLVAKKVWTPES